MKQWQKILLIITGVAIMVISTVTFLGYRQYRAAIRTQSLDEKIAEIQNNANFIPGEAIDAKLFNATVAIEDRRFYHHGAIDFFATSRALLGNIFGFNQSGGSTITQQLAKNMYFGYEPSILRKVAEMFVARDLEEVLTKDEILTLYVNMINYGDNHMGIKEAAYGYFGIAPAQLTLAQASLLAGLPQSPANYQLSDHGENALLRQKQVLSAMVKAGYINEAEATAASEEAKALLP